MTAPQGSARKRSSQRRPWNGAPDEDLPPAELRQVLVIATTPRVASNFFDDGLRRTGLAGAPYEYLLPEQLRQYRQRTGVPVPAVRGRLQMAKGLVRRSPSWDSRVTYRGDSLIEHLRRLAARRTTPNGVFSLKVHFGDWAATIEQSGIDISELGVPVRWVHLERRDRLAQAVSLTIARDTAQWNPREARRRHPTFDIAAIEGNLDDIVAWNRMWRERLAARAEPTIHLWSEDVVADPGPAIAATLRLLGEDPAVLDAPDPSLVQRWHNPDQDLRHRWIDRAIAERPHLAELRFAPDHV
jgi:LPS sulfotransferase NodH